MKRISILALLLPLALLPSCGEQPASSESSQSPLTYGFYTLKAGVTDLGFLQGYPWLNTSVVGVMDKIEKPALKDDFFASENYDALQGIVLPEDAQLGGGYYDRQNNKNKENANALFADSNNEIAKIRKTIIEGAPTQVKEEVETLRKADEVTVRDILSSSKALEGISKFLMVTHVTGREAIGLSFAKDMRFAGLPFLVQLYSKNSTEGIKKDAELIAKAIGLPDDLSGDISEAIDAMAGMFVAIASSDANTAHETTLGNLHQVFNGVFDAKSALKSLGCKDEQKVLYTDYEVALAKQFDALLDAGKASTLAKILAVTKLVDGRAFMGLENYKAKLADKLETIGGITGRSPEFDPSYSDEDIARIYVEKLYPEAVKRAYIDTHITSASRTRVTRLVEDVIAQTADVFKQTTWLSKETIAKAIEKLDAMEFTVFYDDAYVSIAPFAVDTGDDALETFDDYSHYVTLNLAKGNISNDAIGEEKCETFNAYYVPGTNSFAICHGLCSSYIDDPSLSKEQLYGLLGITVGHEITHGFDSTGSLYDKTGKKGEWWSEEDRAKFNQKLDALVTYFDANLRSFNDIPMNGKNVSGEVMADMGGVKIVTELAEKQQGFDFDAFYRAFASFFSFATSEESARSALPYDPHPLNNIRLNLTLAQFDRFKTTYGLKEGDGMFIPPEQSIAIW